MLEAKFELAGIVHSLKCQRECLKCDITQAYINSFKNYYVDSVQLS